jgi:DNA-binding MarR family transcriptional regulator
MTLTESLKPCHFRETKFGQLICTIAEHEESNRTSTKITSEITCRQCQIPDITHSVNCLNLNSGRQHFATQGMSWSGDLEITDINANWHLNCSAIGFSAREDYQDKCSKNCSAYKPINRDLIDEALIRLDNFSATQATDRDLRQAVLAILYQYHARHPERFDYFDVTPDFIAKSLDITIQDVVRIVAPMEEEGEVTTKRYAHDIHFRYIAIRSKGIRMMDEEPLFKNTAQVRSEMNFYGPSYGVAAKVEGNQSIQSQ